MNEKEFVRELVHVAVGVGGGVIVIVAETSEEKDGVEEGVAVLVGGGVIVWVLVMDGSSLIDRVLEADRLERVKLIERSSDRESTPSLILGLLLTDIDPDLEIDIVDVIDMDLTEAVKLSSDDGDCDRDDDKEFPESVSLIVAVREAVPVNPRKVALVQTVWL